MTQDERWKGRYNEVKTFGLCMRPIELNIMYSILGNGMFLYDTTYKTATIEKNKYSKAFMNFMMHGIAPHEIWKYAKQSILDAIKNKLLK